MLYHKLYNWLPAMLTLTERYFQFSTVAACFYIIHEHAFWKTLAFSVQPSFPFSRYAIFLSLSVSGTQQTARMNDFGHGIDPHAVLPRLACQYTHTDLPCQYLRRPQNCSQTETLRQDFSRAKAHNKPGEDITKQTAEQLRFIACSYKKSTLSKHTATRSMIYCRIL